MFETIVDATRGMTAGLASGALPGTDSQRVAEMLAQRPPRWASPGGSPTSGGLSTSRSRGSRRPSCLAWAAWRAGRVSEWRVSILARETACLTLEHRLVVDREIAGRECRIERIGDREVLGYCRERAAALDPAAVVARRRRAEANRRVTIRPAPDSMVHLSALLPVAAGVAAYAALSRAPTPPAAAGPPAAGGRS